MEVPEKIYLIPDNKMVDNLSIIWYEAPYSTGAIEYTRTDTMEVKNIMTIEEIQQKAKELAQRYFPDELNIWARPNYEAQAVEEACMEICKWADQTIIDRACKFLKSYRQETPDGMGYMVGIVNDKMIEDFCKAIKVENCEIEDSINIRLDHEQADLIVNALHEFRTIFYERSRMDNSENTPMFRRALDTIDRLKYQLKSEIANKLKLK